MSPSPRRLLSVLYRGKEAKAHTPAEIWEHWTGYIRDRIEHHEDAVVVIGGPEGSGKSALALTLCRELDPSFTPESRIFFRTQPFLEWMGKVGAGQAGIWDEASQGTRSQDRWTDEVRAVIRAVQVIRAARGIMVLVTPEIWDMATTFRARRAQVYLRCLPRPRMGQAMVHTRSDKIQYHRPGSELGLWVDREWSPLQWPDPSPEAWWQRYEEWSLAAKRALVLSEAEKLQPKKTKIDNGPYDATATCPVCGVRMRRDSVRRHAATVHRGAPSP